MRAILLIAACTILAAFSARAEITPQSGPGDPHIQTVQFDAQEVVMLKVALGYALTVEFSPDERIDAVSVGNSGVWQVTSDKEASRLFIKPMQGSVDTNMTVITDTRIYSFDLKYWPSPDLSTPYIVRFTYPAAPQPAIEGLAKENGAKPPSIVVTYRFSGSSRLKPTSMSDDGHSTFIVWPEKSPIPAVSIIEETGKQVLANGAVRDGRLVIGEVAEKFIFRFDGETAVETRHAKKVRRR
jgi:type IV secretion system protein VirB9